MAVPPPILDDRDLRDILQQLKVLAALSVPEWTPPTDGDAGTMLQRVYARLLELALLRLNEVPEKNLLAFLDVMGVSLLAPSPARAPLTFGLTKGTPPTLISRGAQAGSQATDELPALIFETEDDLTVIPAQITQSYTMDPAWDRYTDQTSVLGGQSGVGFTSFVGTRRMPHVVYIGDDALLDFSRTTTVRFDFDFTSGGQTDAEVAEFLAQLVYQYRSQGTLKTITPSVVPPAVGSGTARIFFLIPDSIDEEVLKGVGPAGALQTAPGRWLRAVLALPFPDSPLAKALRLRLPLLHVEAVNLLPDLAFANTAPADFTKDFFPFGETPKVGDTFYLASREALEKPNAIITLNIRVRQPDPPKLIWEYSAFVQRGETIGDELWLPFVSVSRAEADDAQFKARFSENPFSYIVDETEQFTRPGFIDGRAVRMRNRRVNGVTASWVRARLDEGGYSKPPRIRNFVIVTRAGVRNPKEGFANKTPIIFTREFQPYGTEPGKGDTFYFGEPGNVEPEEGGFPVEAIKDIPVSRIQAIVSLGPAISPRPRATLQWEYLSQQGWVQLPSASVEDNTVAFTQDGSIKLRMPVAPLPRAAAGKVNDQSDYWLRVRIDGGDYGRPAEFVPVDPDDPKQGFKLRPGTGNLQPPQIVFLTIDYEAEDRPALVTQNGFLYRDETSTTSGFAPFVSVRELVPDIYADAEPALYLGLDSAFPEKPVTLYADITPRAFAGTVIKETRNAPAPSSLFPPLRWEYFNGTAWRELTVFDATNNFTVSGTVSFLTPEDIAALTKFDLTARFWIRVRSSGNDPFDTQNLLGIFLNTVPAIQAVTAQNEIIGSSSEELNQRFSFARSPVLPKQEIYVREPESPSDTERDRVENDEGPDAISERINPETGQTEVWVRWHEIDTFIKSDKHSRHYTLDRIAGQIRFGDGVHGVIPPRGTNNIVANYRSGGGSNGNVQKAGIAQVKSALPGVATVLNQVAADGGAEVETIPMVEERGPQTLKHRSRAVSSADIEWLAGQAAGTRVARSRCLANVNRDLRFEPGWTTLIIVPDGREAKLSPSSQLIREVESYLDARAYVGLAQQTPSRINVIGPGYIKVSVNARVVPQDIDQAEAIKQLLVAALKAFLHPLTGGPIGAGWEFGRDVYASEIAQALEAVRGVNHLETLQLFANVVQHRLTFNSPPVTISELPAGSEVITTDRRKAALLAETVSAGGAVERIKIKGFKEGDLITRAVDLRVTSMTAATDGGFHVGVTNLDGSPALSDTVGFPVGSLVTTFDGAVRLRLTAAILRNRPSAIPITITEILVEDSDAARDLGVAVSAHADIVLTVFYPFPMKVTATKLETITLSVQSVSGSTINTKTFNSSIAVTPRNSIVSAFDDTRRAHLNANIGANQTGLTTISVQEPSFSALLRSGDELELHTPVQILNLEPYETEVTFPLESLITTLDNRVRAPLLEAIVATQPVTAIKLHDFINADNVSINRRDRTGSLSGLTIFSVEPLTDIVFLDDNFLVYSDSHRITLVGEAKDGSV